MTQEWDTRVGAYAVVVHGDHILLAHWNERGREAWTLPGGGLELGEDAPTAAVREVLEETGYVVELDELLGVDSLQVRPEDRLNGSGRPLHALRIIYRAHPVSGELVHELGGSTDEAAWVPLADVPNLTRVDLIDKALELSYQSPARALR
ncbi:NUDIX hydrolase [Arthrobacter sp.]|uniref:NUDIX hydrolase n=1 Tax=Arthrobacter sp. TaxID=1667 RepID=UPI0028123B5C|nr:NUDIX hydrolase [Arthrobacter sp.]